MKAWRAFVTDTIEHWTAYCSWYIPFIWIQFMWFYKRFVGCYVGQVLHYCYYYYSILFAHYKCTQCNRDVLHNIALYKFLIRFHSIVWYLDLGGRATSSDEAGHELTLQYQVLHCFLCGIVVGTHGGVSSLNTVNVGLQPRTVTSANLCYGDTDVWTSHSASVSVVDLILAISVCPAVVCFWLLVRISIV